MKYTIMTSDLFRLWDFYSKYDKFHYKRGLSNVFQVADIQCSTSLESGNRTLLSKVVGLYQKLLSNNSKYIRENDIISNVSNGPYIFQLLNEKLAYDSKLYMYELNNKDVIHQISYEVYDPLLGGGNFTLLTGGLVMFSPSHLTR